MDLLNILNSNKCAENQTKKEAVVGDNAKMFIFFLGLVFCFFLAFFLAFTQHSESSTISHSVLILPCLVGGFVLSCVFACFMAPLLDDDIKKIYCLPGLAVFLLIIGVWIKLIVGHNLETGNMTSSITDSIAEIFFWVTPLIALYAVVLAAIVRILITLFR